MDLDEVPIIHGLELPSRCMCAQTAETNVTRFLVATQSLRQENQLHFIEFDDENNVIDKTVYSHPLGEVWHLSSSCNDTQLFSSCYHSFKNGKLEAGCMIWQFPEADDESDVKSLTSNLSQGDLSGHNFKSLEQVAALEAEEFGAISCTYWKPTEGENKLMAVSCNNMLLYDMDQSAPELVSSFSLPNRKGHPSSITAGRWNLHHSGRQFAVATDQNIIGWDVRSKDQAFLIENAHGQLVRDVDFNPNKMYYMTSCGDDCKIKFWDIRNTGTKCATYMRVNSLNCAVHLTDEPVQVISNDHSHWVWSARYNPFHDQLVLSGGSDSKVILYNMMSISSEPDGHVLVSDEENDSIDGDDQQAEVEKTIVEDGVIGVYEEHEDSVYAVEWSSADPWTFASLSYDGRFIINRVPKKIKYGILL